MVCFYMIVRIRKYTWNIFIEMHVVVFYSMNGLDLPRVEVETVGVTDPKR